VSPREYTWHEEAMCKGHWHVGLVGGWLTKLPSRPVPVCSLPWVSLVVTLSKRRLNGTRALESVEAALDGHPATWLGRLTSTWWIIDLIKLVTTPGTLINTPHALHRSVVLTWVTILLGLYNPPHRDNGEPAKPGLMYPLVWIPYCDTVSEKPGSWSTVASIAGDLES
jgi:hypothetical protein